MSYHHISKTHIGNFMSYRSHMTPNPTYQSLPWTLGEVASLDIEIEQISDTEAKCMLHSQLVYLQQYAKVIYDNGESEDTPGWVLEFMMTPSSELSKVIYDVSAGRRYFRNMERSMRPCPTTELSLQVTNILKVSYNYTVMINVIGGAAFYIMNTVVRQLSREAQLFAQHEAIWKGFGTLYAKRFVETYPELSPGVHDQLGKDVREGYVYLARVLVLGAGMSKAEVARLLGVSRLSVNNWLAESK